MAPELANACRMVIAALVGFMVAAQFVSLAGLEIPYYVTLVGAGYLKLGDRLAVADPDWDSENDTTFITGDGLLIRAT